MWSVSTSILQTYGTVPNYFDFDARLVGRCRRLNLSDSVQGSNPHLCLVKILANRRQFSVPWIVRINSEHSPETVNFNDLKQTPKDRWSFPRGASTLHVIISTNRPASSTRISGLALVSD
jgi:hypothetical protein